MRQLLAQRSNALLEAIFFAHFILNAWLQHLYTLYEALYELGVKLFLDHAALEKCGIDDVVQTLEMLGDISFYIRQWNDVFGNNELGEMQVVIVDDLLKGIPGDTLLRCVHIYDIDFIIFNN